MKIALLTIAGTIVAGAVIAQPLLLVVVGGIALIGLLVGVVGQWKQ